MRCDLELGFNEVGRDDHAMKPSPKIPEAVIPGTPFRIEVLKVAFVLFFVFSLIEAIPGLQSVHTEHYQFVANHGFLSHLLSLGYAAFFAVGSYGIHRRKRVAWKVGWFYLGFLYLSAVVSAIAASWTTVPASDRWIMLPVFVVMISAVAVYWGYWWKKQEAYFKS
jgi:hypothetical protein